MNNQFNTEPFVILGQKFDSLLTDQTIKEAIEDNQWFTAQDIKFAAQVLKDTLLNAQSLEQWLSQYTPAQTSRQDIGVVMAGNIPFAGFYDMMCVVMCGHNCHVKTSSKDKVLMQKIFDTLNNIDDTICIQPLEEATACDALIFSGSDAAAQVYQNRYGDIKTIMRTSRFSVAVINETTDLNALAQDLFVYFGLGCRNVSMILAPDGYDLTRLQSLDTTKLQSHRGFSNNYRAAKGLLSLTGAEFIDCNGFLLTPSERPSSNISQVSYTLYKDTQQVQKWLEDNNDKIQCVVCDSDLHPRSCRVGHAQMPQATDFADGIDVIEFLMEL